MPDRPLTTAPPSMKAAGTCSTPSPRRRQPALLDQLPHPVTDSSCSATSGTVSHPGTSRRDRSLTSTSSLTRQACHSPDRCRTPGHGASLPPAGPRPGRRPSPAAVMSGRDRPRVGRVRRIDHRAGRDRRRPWARSRGRPTASSADQTPVPVSQHTAQPGRPPGRRARSAGRRRYAADVLHVAAELLGPEVRRPGRRRPADPSRVAAPPRARWRALSQCSTRSRRPSRGDQRAAQSPTAKTPGQRGAQVTRRPRSRRWPPTSMPEPASQPGRGRHPDAHHDHVRVHPAAVGQRTPRASTRGDRACRCAA